MMRAHLCDDARTLGVGCGVQALDGKIDPVRVLGEPHRDQVGRVTAIPDGWTVLITYQDAYTANLLNLSGHASGGRHMSLNERERSRDDLPRAVVVIEHVEAVVPLRVVGEIQGRVGGQGL